MFLSQVIYRIFNDLCVSHCPKPQACGTVGHAFAIKQLLNTAETQKISHEYIWTMKSRRKK